jgi:hypothetical protein
MAPPLAPAGTVAGSWFAGAARRDEELIATNAGRAQWMQLCPLSSGAQ